MLMVKARLFLSNSWPLKNTAAWEKKYPMKASCGEARHVRKYHWSKIKMSVLIALWFYWLQVPIFASEVSCWMLEALDEDVNIALRCSFLEWVASGHVLWGHVFLNYECMQHSGLSLDNESEHCMLSLFGSFIMFRLWKKKIIKKILSMQASLRKNQHKLKGDNAEA